MTGDPILVSGDPSERADGHGALERRRGAIDPPTGDSAREERLFAVLTAYLQAVESRGDAPEAGKRSWSANPTSPMSYRRSSRRKIDCIAWLNRCGTGAGQHSQEVAAYPPTTALDGRRFPVPAA